MGDEEYVEGTCSACGDLKDSVGNCYTCSEEHIELRKDFVWEYAHESVSEKYTRFRQVNPFSDE